MNREAILMQIDTVSSNKVVYPKEVVEKAIKEYNERNNYSKLSLDEFGNVISTITCDAIQSIDLTGKL